MYYCLNCGVEDDFTSPCLKDSIGSHRIVERGSKKYRVRKISGDGYIYLFSSIPVGYELVETITY